MPSYGLVINFAETAKKNREEHRAELDQYQEAVSFFRDHCDGKVPVMKELKAEKEKLLTLQSEQRKELSAMLLSINSSSTVCKCS